MNGTVAFLIVFLAGCSRNADGKLDSPNTLHVAAAANLSRLFPTLSRACLESTGISLVPVFGNTAQLAQQIEGGAPIDLFLAADEKHVADLRDAGRIVSNSMHNYAQGKLVIFAPRHVEVQSIQALTLSSVKKIGIAKPELSPYGSGSVQSLKNSKLWDALEPKVVYGQNISAVLQFVDSSNVDAAFTALALVYDNPGNKVIVDPALYSPLNQALGIPSGTTHREAAERAATWFLSPQARKLFQSAGYGIAAQENGRAAAPTPATLKP